MFLNMLFSKRQTIVFFPQPFWWNYIFILILWQKSHFFHDQLTKIMFFLQSFDQICNSWQNLQFFCAPLSKFAVIPRPFDEILIYSMTFWWNLHFFQEIFVSSIILWKNLFFCCFLRKLYFFFHDPFMKCAVFCQNLHFFFNP